MSKKFRRGFSDTLCRCCSHKDTVNIVRTVLYESPSHLANERSVTLVSQVGCTIARLGSNRKSAGGQKRSVPAINRSRNTPPRLLEGKACHLQTNRQTDRVQSPCEKKNLKDFISFRRKDKPKSDAKNANHTDGPPDHTGCIERNVNGSVRSIDSANSSSGSVTSFAAHIREELELREVLPSSGRNHLQLINQN